MASRFSKFDKFLATDEENLSQSDQDFLKAVDTASLQPSAASISTPVEDIYASSNLGPVSGWSNDLLGIAAKQGRPEAIAEANRRGLTVPASTRFVPATQVKPSPAAQPTDEVDQAEVDAQEARRLADAKRETATVARAKAEQARAKAEQARAILLGRNLGNTNWVTDVPASGAPTSDATAPRPTPAARHPSAVPAPAPVAQRTPPDTSASFPKLGTKLAGSLVDRLIPVANAPVKADVPGAVKGAIPATTSDQPAPPVDGSGGDDDVRNLYLARLAAQSAAGFGGMGAGKNIDMGIADTLGERLKQVEALRAKREEQTLEQQRERLTWGSSNRATLASALAQWKDDPEKTAALEALASGADTTKPGDFSRNVVNAVMTKPKALGVEATTAKTGAGITRLEGQAATEEATREPKVDLLKTRANLAQAQIDKLRRQTAGNVVGLTRSAKAIEDAGKGGMPSRDAIKYIRDDIKTAEKAITPTLENFKNIERASPGFAFGKPDKSVATLDFVAAEKLPAFADKARDLRSAVGALINDIRHGTFGASLTPTEKEQFEAVLNTGLSGTVEQLSRALNMVRQKAAATAQTHFNTSMSFYPSETSQVLSSSAVFGPATREGGVYSDVWRVRAPSAGGGAARPPKPEDKPGAKTLWNKKTGQWVRYTPEQEAKARAADAVED